MLGRRVIVLRDRQLEGIIGMSVFLIQGPSDLLVKLFDRGLCLLGNVTHNRVYRLALVIPFLTLSDILR